MLSRVWKALRESGDIGPAPAAALVGLILLLIAAVFWWRDYATSRAKSPDYSSPNIALPGGMTLPGAKPAQVDAKASQP